MLARASPRKPYVPSSVKSLKSLILLVVNRSHNIGRSSFWDRTSLCQDHRTGWEGCLEVFRPLGGGLLTLIPEPLS